MASTSTYLNFNRECEDAFNLYRSVFGGDWEARGLIRFGDGPEGEHPIPEEDKNLVMNVGLRITGNHLLMGSDAPPSMGLGVTFGNSSYICVDPDTRTEADRIFAGLSEGGEVEMPLTEMFWGDYFGTLTDKFGVRWMVNCSSKE